MGAFLSTLFSGFASVLGSIVGYIAQVLAGLIVHLLLTPALALASGLLKMTLFKSWALTGHGVVAAAVQRLFGDMAVVSVAVALVAFLWGLFRRMMGGLSGTGVTWQDIGEGVGIYALMLAGGFEGLTLLFHVTSTVAQGFIQAASSMQASLYHLSFTPTSGAAASVGVIVAVLFWPTTLLLIAGFMFWAIFQWLSRELDLIVYVGLLPVTAALGLSGNRQPFQWNWNEAMGAIFAQLSMALMWWVAFLVLTAHGNGHLIPTNPPINKTITPGTATSFLQLALAAVAFSMVARAPSMLQSLTGHQHAGVASMALGFAGGALLARTARSSMAMSSAGQAVGALQKAGESGAQVRMMNKAARPTASQRLENSKLGNWVANSRVGRWDQRVSSGSNKVSSIYRGAKAAGRSVMNNAATAPAGHLARAGAHAQASGMVHQQTLDTFRAAQARGVAASMGVPQSSVGKAAFDLTGITEEKQGQLLRGYDPDHPLEKKTRARVVSLSEYRARNRPLYVDASAPHDTRKTN